MKHCKTCMCEQDVASLASEKGGYCVLHDRDCRRTGSAEMIILGFTCKGNSEQNSKRWAADPTDTDSKSMKAFELSLSTLSSNRPRFFILENVEGCMSEA